MMEGLLMVEATNWVLGYLMSLFQVHSLCSVGIRDWVAIPKKAVVISQYTTSACTLRG